MANMVPSRIVDADATAAQEIRDLFTVVKGIVGDQNAYTASGAIATTSRYASLDSTGGALTMTLAAPGADDVGRLLVIQMIEASNASTLALTNVIGGSAATTATFDAVNETLTLVAAANKWVVIDEHGVTLA